MPVNHRIWQQVASDALVTATHNSMQMEVSRPLLLAGMVMDIVQVVHMAMLTTIVAVTAVAAAGGGQVT